MARQAILSRPDALREIRALPIGVYLFGHNHLQFYMEFEGRLLINPGSCGDPCDCDPTAAYTLLEYDEVNIGSGRWNVTERRIVYDLEATARGLRESELTTQAPLWSVLIERQLMTGIDYFGPFVKHIVKIGREHSQYKLPVSNDLWDIAVKTWAPDI